MDFTQILRKVCADFGKEIVFENKIISILADYGAFKDLPAYKIIYKLFLSEFSLKEYMYCGDRERQRLLINQFIENTGINEVIALNLVNIIQSGISEEAAVDNQTTEIGRTDRSQVYDTSTSEIWAEDERNDPLPMLQNKIGCVKFLGVELGSQIKSFVDELKRRQVKFIDGRATKTFEMQNFLSYPNVKIELNTYEFSPVVKTIIITFSKNHTSRVGLDKLYNHIHGLFVEKYSPGNSNVSSWHIGQCDIEIKKQGFWNDGVWGNVQIKYSYSDPNLIKNDLIEKQIRNDALLREKQIRKEEEERKRKQKEEQEKKRRQSIHQQSLNDI